MSRGGILTALMIAFMFMQFLNGDIGWALIYTLIGASAVSIVLLCISERHFTVRLSELSGITECGRRIELEIELKKTGFCVLPFVEVVIDTGAGAVPVVIRTSLIFGKEKRVSAHFKALHSGLNSVTLKGVTAHDFMGIAPRKIPLNQIIKKAVLPRVVEYDGPEIVPNTLPSEEEVEVGATVQTGGVPGYEHREYVPGDSPRRVNYKLSAKKGTLMVRLDESQGTKAINLFIADNAMPICGDKAFALASRLVIRGGSVKITHKEDCRTASTPETLERMREWLAFREFAAALDNSPTGTPPPDTALMFSGGGAVTRVAAH